MNKKKKVKSPKVLAGTKGLAKPEHLRPRTARSMHPSTDEIQNYRPADNSRPWLRFGFFMEIREKGVSAAIASIIAFFKSWWP